MDTALTMEQQQHALEFYVKFPELVEKMLALSAADKGICPKCGDPALLK